jgi:cob(I)alamin adenosyltransferase
MTHLYIGDGKGKTTAALGLALRACGAGKMVYVGILLKDSKFSCSEAASCKRLGIRLERFTNQTHPIFDKNNSKKNITSDSLDASIEKIKKIIVNKKYDVVVVDELLNALDAGFINESCVREMIVASKGTELILTGRDAPLSVIKYADYVSRIKKIKHPFDKKIYARKGVEY